MAVQVGDQIGEYRLVRALGSGSFGIVYQAKHVLVGTQVAIKVLHGSMTEAERLELRAEALRQAALEHPHIVPVITYAEQPVPYLVMKYAPNGTLAQRYPAGQRQPLASILPHVRQIAEGLQHAHDQQTLHLDLKPANVLLGSRQEALISDFGISLILQQQKTHQTVDHVAGTPAYMAPEQLQGKPGKASDQYALATMVYQWLTGTFPFTGDVWSMGMLKLTQDPPPLRQHVPDLPLEMEQVVLRALSKDPKTRFASVKEFATMLEQVSLYKLPHQEVPSSVSLVLPPPPNDPRLTSFPLDRSAGAVEAPLKRRPVEPPPLSKHLEPLSVVDMILSLTLILAFFLPWFTIKTSILEVSFNGISYATGDIYLWLVPLMALVLMSLSLWCMSRKAPFYREQIFVILGFTALALISEAAFFLDALSLQHSLAVGFWIAVLATVAVGVTSLLGLAQERA